MNRFYVTVQTRRFSKWRGANLANMIFHFFMNIFDMNFQILPSGKSFWANCAWKSFREPVQHVWSNTMPRRTCRCKLNTDETFSSNKISYSEPSICHSTSCVWPDWLFRIEGSNPTGVTQTNLKGWLLLPVKTCPLNNLSVAQTCVAKFNPIVAPVR